MKNKKGFTLAELLVVVAIIAVLIAIAIPVFTAQLEKSREAVDAANIRSKYAELMVDVVSGDVKTSGYTVTLKQETAGWTITPEWPANLKGGDAVTAGGTATLTWDADKGEANVAFSK